MQISPYILHHTFPYMSLCLSFVSYCPPPLTEQPTFSHLLTALVSLWVRQEVRSTISGEKQQIRHNKWMWENGDHILPERGWDWFQGNLYGCLPGLIFWTLIVGCKRRTKGLHLQIILVKTVDKNELKSLKTDDCAVMQRIIRDIWQKKKNIS